MAEDTIRVLTTQDLRYGTLPLAAFYERVLRDDLGRVWRATFPAGDLPVGQLEALGDVELAERHPTGLTALVRLDARTLVYVSLLRGSGELVVAADDAAAAERIAADLVGALRDHRRERDHVPITF
jgi:hypothetical protein